MNTANLMSPMNPELNNLVIGIDALQPARLATAPAPAPVGPAAGGSAGPTPRNAAATERDPHLGA